MAPTTAAPSTPSPTTSKPCLLAPPPPTYPDCSQTEPNCVGKKISQACTSIPESSVPHGSTIYSLCACIYENQPDIGSTLEELLLYNRYKACANVIGFSECDPDALVKKSQEILVCYAFRLFVVGDICLDSFINGTKI